MHWLITVVSTLLLIKSCHAQKSQLLMISFDGFRWDYLKLAAENNRSTPNFNKLISESVTVEPAGMKNIFNTKTFPNHYSLATGLFEEEHGIVGNHFYDPVFNATFKVGTPSALEYRFWNGTKDFTVEPIWITNEKTQSNPEEPKRASGVFFWPGSEVPGQQPKFFKSYDKSYEFKNRVDTLIDWLTSDTEPVNLAMMYYHEPDKTGHTYGPTSTQLLDKLVELDNLLGYFLDRLKEKNLHDTLDLIITSDHGMSSISKNIYVDDYVSAEKFNAYGATPTWGIFPKEGNLDEVLAGLQKIENLKVYQKADIPERFHYRNNRRIAPILIGANPDYNLCLRARNDTCSDLGNHGFDNDNQEMHPIFIAHGKSFKRNYISKPFNSVDIYPLICLLLEISPRPNNGSLDNMKPMLRSRRDDVNDDDDGESIIHEIYKSPNFFIYVLLFGFVIAPSFIGCIFALRTYAIVRRRSMKSWERLSSNSLNDVNKQPLLVSDDEKDVA